MAFQKDKTTAAQTAANGAAEIVAALVTAGVLKTTAKADEYFDARFTATLDLLDPIVEADNEMFREQAGSGDGETSTKKRRSSKSSGSRSNGKITVKQARELELNGGMFKGLTLGEVVDMSADDAEEYGAREGQSGKNYVKFLASTKNRNAFVRKFAKVLVAPKKAADEDEDEDEGSDEDED
jgi:hypothetical protein